VVNREVRQFIAELERRGLAIHPTRSGHFRITTRGGRYLTTLPSTPSDARSLKNAGAQIRRGLKKRSR
jgi:hypothetical protein